MALDHLRRIISIEGLPLSDLPVTRLATFEAVADGLDDLERRQLLLAWSWLDSAQRRLQGLQTTGSG